MKKKKYKVWLHLEEIILDKKGGEVDYISLDDVYLPVEAGETNNMEEAISLMELIHERYYQNSFYGEE
jgi:hypothetical protein